MSIFSDDLEAKGVLPSPEEDEDAPPAFLKKGAKKKSIFAADLEAKGFGDDAPTAPGSRPFKNTGPDLAGQTKADLDAFAAEQAPEHPTILQRAKRTAGDLAETFVGGAKAVGTGVVHPIDTITSGPRRRQFERGIDDMVTLGYGQKLAARVGNLVDSPDVAIGPETFGGGIAGSGGDPVANTQAKDQEVAPEFRQLGHLVGAGSPGATSGIAKAGMKGAQALLPAAAGAKGLTAAALDAGRGLASYQLAAPVTTALSAGAEGDRVGAALDAATDPVGNALAGGLGGAGSLARTAGEKLGNRIEETKGVKARRLIEERGGGAKVGLTSPGKGGVFERELADIGPGDQAVGTAAQRGGEMLVQQIKDDHALETSRPYRELKAKIDNTPMARELRDVTPIVLRMQEAVDDLETPSHVRSQLKEHLDLLEKHRQGEDGPVMLPERQLNGLRRELMRASKIGTTDAPSGADAPLRAAAMMAKNMVDEGPYARLNELFASGAKATAERRKLAGLAKKLPTDENVDFNKARLNLQRGEAETNSATGGAFTDRIRQLREQNPDYSTAIDLPALARARNDLSFHVAPSHGGLMARAGGGALAAPLAAYGMLTHPLATLGALGAGNIKPIQGRILAPLADRLRAPASAPSLALPVAITRLIQAGRAGASREQLHVQAEKDGVPPEYADRIADASGL